jgi:hypothetical protein
MASEKKTAADLTIAELADAVANVLADGYVGVRSGRVRHLPDARTIRWYQTLGMVDRPTTFRGRTALFSRRHVLQLAAIKRLQAADHPLAGIQQGLAGKTDAELARAAGTPLADVERCISAVVGGRGRGDANVAMVTAPVKAAAPRPTTAFWKARPIDTPPPPASAAVPVAGPATLQSISLGDRAALVWTGQGLTAAEHGAALRLARPLIEFLSSRLAGGAEPAGGTVHPSARPQQEKGAR